MVVIVIFRMLSLGGRVCLFNDSGVDALMGFLAEAAHPCTCKTFGVALFNDCSRHEAGQLYPAIIGSEFVGRG